DLPAERGVGLERPWVLVKVFARAKLQLVHEDRDNREVAFGYGPLDQRGVPLVERSHRRDKADSLPFSARLCDPPARLLNPMDDHALATFALECSARSAPCGTSARRALWLLVISVLVVGVAPVAHLF